ncbi:N-6 DNA Methylase [Candidatus Methylobacter favarea]|uniref:site-specific DNA-methyltransferase (adenine-specific) n=1 Tax=Candidatus Methylobacter favarea TaxID=2707345 RepID=A0A8S0WJ57_9GAMM|nr:N-6 DNA methylase [Candidatus Methylobacter favarea]CAA9891064.1 N-6 DNA Methylase [Candidatus Methylobacter favarea]
MLPLDKSLRNKLERTIKDARDIAEAAAKAALEQLGVGEASPFVHLSEAERELRRKLRVHGRQLGDVRYAQIETQEVDRLVEEVAYEHWHRMLFARFLAENNLLMYPDPDEPVAVTLEECDDLAADEGAANGWELAARFAARMLPQIFRLDSPVFQLSLPPEHQQKLEHLVTDLPQETFTASDSLGWVYQFWQANNKDRINKSEVKIGARELPAVTQLFTEPYMVSFLLDNALGAWWAARRLTETDLKSAASEEELRSKTAIPGVPLEYLRFIQQEDNSWTPAAGTFEQWPEHLSELKTLDPCCGSGHFLVAVFLMLVPMRMELEGLNAREAVDRVLSENIHGLELDQRCVELAVFALALTAWRYPGAGGYRGLQELHLACSGLSVSVAKEEWKQLGLGKKNLTIALDWLHDTFKDAPVLGSLLNPAKTQAAKIVEWDELSRTLTQALSQEQTDEQHEIGVVAQGLAKAAILLAGHYQWVITNVPYLARSKQNERLQDFCERHYPAAKNDLATIFLDRCLELCIEGGTSSIVLPQNWLFLTTYKKFREKLLSNDTWHFIARLGQQAFQTPMWDFNVQLISISRSKATRQLGGLFGDADGDNLIRGVDVSELRSAVEKAKQLLTTEIISVKQSKQLDNPDCIVQLNEHTAEALFASFASYFQGTSTGDNPRFVGSFWEIGVIAEPWQFMETVSNESQHFGGKGSVINWEVVNSFEGSAVRGWDAFSHKGVAIGQMAQLPATIYLGQRFPNTTPVIVTKHERTLPAVWAFCMSDSFSLELRKVNQKLSVDNGYVGKIPFDLEHWTKIAEEQYPNGLPKPYSDDPTQWIFHGHPCGSVIWDHNAKWTEQGTLRTDDTVLQVAVARLLGYRWPAELDAKMELADQQREWVNRCESLLPFAADRLLNLLAAAYGDAWSNDILAQLLKSSDHAGKTLETWLREKFFTQHCKIFQHRPFIWHMWDGLRDGFAALVNYHKLDYKLLETLIYTYLGDWIRTQKDAIDKGIDGAEEKLAAAENLKKKLELILEGEGYPDKENPEKSYGYDIFVRWKRLDKQPIGWNPDFNDGVRLNIRPFLSVPDVGKKGAGVLRDKPNIKWDKDRGKDVESAPWYHLFNGDRINDHHLSLAEKRAVREKE